MSSVDNLIDRVLFNPSQAYRIYKYIQADNARFYKDPRVLPHALDYVVGVAPKLQKRVQTIDGQGSLIYVEWWAYDDAGENPIEEVLKVTIEYAYAEDAPVKSARTVTSRVVTRQWIKEDGIYQADALDAKITRKFYRTYRDSKKVGVARRENLAALGEEGFITLVTLLITGGDQEVAEALGKAILARYEQHYQLFMDNGSDQFTKDILNDVLNDPIQDTSGNVISNPSIPLGISDNDLLNQLIPATINLGQGDIPFDMVVRGSQGKTIRQYIIDKYNGDIN